MVAFGLLRDLAQKELSEYLDKYAGTKVNGLITYYDDNSCKNLSSTIYNLLDLITYFCI